MLDPEAVDPLMAVGLDGNGVSSRTPSLSVSIHRVSPEVRGYRESGNVIMAVSLVEWLRRRARRPWRNCKTCSGTDAAYEYIAGERKLGITTRWTVDGRAMASCVVR